MSPFTNITSRLVSERTNGVELNLESMAHSSSDGSFDGASERVPRVA